MSENTPSRIKTHGVSAWWRALSIVLALALVLAWATAQSMVEQLKAQIVHLQGKVDRVPQVRHVSVLLDDQGQPGLLVTFDPTTQALQLQRLNDVKEGRDQSLQLWALREGQAPKSLGGLDSRYKTLQLSVTEAALAGVGRLGVSVETKGGVSDAQGPNAPWLFMGALVQRAK